MSIQDMHVCSGTTQTQIPTTLYNYYLLSSAIFDRPQDSETFSHIQVSPYLNPIKIHHLLALTQDTLVKIQFIYLFGFYVAFNTIQVISRRVVGRAEETST